MKIPNIFFISAAMSSFATAVEFEKPFQLKENGKAIYHSEVNCYISPAFSDIDGDGKTDLILGLYSRGKMKFFKNVSTASKTEYKYSGYLKTAGKTASIPGVW